MSIVETFHGFIETTQDTLLIFEACHRGLLPRICRRLQEKERRIVQSGTVFVFDERESGIKRWTDGLVWSPSRILGNFLVYRELDKRNSGKKDASPIDRASRSSSSDVESAIEKNKERALVGSLTNSYRFKKNGLVKKTMSIVVNGVSQHLISYYSKDDVLQGKLRTPSSLPELASLEISPEFLSKQNFRIPPLMEQLTDPMHSPVSNHSPRTPSAPFHTIGANGADFSSTGFVNNHVRPKTEPEQILDVFSKSYHHPGSQQSQHHQYSPSTYHTTLPHLGQHHHTPHAYSPQHTSFPPSFGYGSPTSGNGTPLTDQSSTTPPPIRPSYLSRPPSGFMSYTSQPQQPSQGQSPQLSASSTLPSVSQASSTSSTQSTTQQTQGQQRHSLSPSPYNSGSPAMMLPSPAGPNGTTAHHLPHDFNLSMGYHSSPSSGSASGFGLSSTGSSHQAQQYHHLPTTQGWNDIASYPPYSSAPATLGPISDHHGQHDHYGSSP
ncbi:hypothetical protein DFQ26_000673 [Actinomortierella ambigua]|nr:hypothetical protein DFQ26_000673 [Actinomortierella ambigua]